MKSGFYIGIILLMILSSCASAKKNFEEGRYDQAIEQAVKKLRKNPGNQKMIDLLNDAYRIANEKDQHALLKLQNENKASNAEQIYLLYVSLDRRQQWIRELPELQPEVLGRDYHFQMLDYSQELADYKARTITFLLDRGNSYMNGDRFAARTAYDYFRKASIYDPYNSIVQQQLEAALNNGYTWVAVSFGAQDGMFMHPYLESQINLMNTSRLNNGWVRFLPMGSSENAHYQVQIVLNQVMMTPERIREKEYTESQTVEDGYVYQYDANGKKVLDEKGKPITKPVYKKVEVKVRRVELSKECTILGSVYLFDNASGKMLSKNDVAGTASFYHVYGLMNGDERALSPESIKLLKVSAPAPFPTQDEMVVQGTPAFANSVEAQLRSRLKELN